MHVLRPVARAATVTALSIVVAFGVAAPARASITATVVDTGGIGLNVRTGPSSADRVITAVGEGASVAVSCQVFGQDVGGNGVWDFLPAYGGYASDFYLLTGYDGRHPSLPLCGGTTPPPPPGSGTRAGVVATARAEVGNGHLAKYGNDPSWEWCSSFATWVWRTNGVQIPNYAFTGDVFTWGQRNGLAHWGHAGLRPGDAVLYGTGPASSSTSLHVGIVESVGGDGRITTIEGNYSSRVTRVGPMNPADVSGWEPGQIYGYVSPVSG